MNSTNSRSLASVGCLAFTVGLLASQQGKDNTVKRLYVEPFTTKTGAEKLRADVVAELHKHKSISLAANSSDADAILGGGGEVWVKGYRSLNPRSGRLPSNGDPVYGGYLSVELKDARGQTFWSYLVTPGYAAEDVSRDLAKQIVRHLPENLSHEDNASVVIPPQTAVTLRGGGATFPDPVYEKWLVNYRRENPRVKITYEPTGSEAGVRSLLAGDLDFGASDNPQAIHTLAAEQENKYLLFPSVVGAVVPIINLPGFPNDIALTPEALAGIYLGKIKKWNDPVLKKANKGLRLPDLDITVVHRKDGSGTSYAWTDYLSKTSSEWKNEVGASLAPKWPVGREANGNDGVAKLVKELGGSIGYVEFIYALQNHLSFSSVQNQDGKFVEASLESIAVAVSQSMQMQDDFKVSIVDSPGSGAYPIASFTWLIIPAHIADEAKRNAIKNFLKWMLGPGQSQSAALGYLALPKDVVNKEETVIEQIR